MRNNVILILIIIILLLIGGGFWYINSLKNDIQEERTALRVEKLKNDKLEKVNDTQYRKLVADSLTQRELNKIVDSLEIALETKPKIVYRTIVEVKEVDKPIDGIVVNDSVVSIVDYYPNKEDLFITYSNKFSLLTKKGNSNWKFTPFTMSLVISQREDGIFQLDSKVPNWMNISSINVQATPLEQEKIDNFGWILGAGLGTELLNQNGYGRFEAGFRWKRMYFDLGLNTNISVDGVIKFEF